MKTRRAITIQPGAPGGFDIVPVIERSTPPPEEFAADIEKLIQAIHDAPLAESDRREGKLKLMQFLDTPAANAVLRDAIPRLRQMMGV